jgi:ABC-type transport system involved in cytochrome c biogenesis ATPase subunit
MPRTKLKSIELTYFRGATQPVTIEFDPDKKVTMIYGENGSGKSSVVDGFDFLCRRDYGSLNDRKGADKDLLTAITGNIEQLGVCLTTHAGRWKANFKRNTKTIVVSPSNGCPDARILRRANILRLIDEIPSKRFEALKGYIDVSGIEKCEKSLGDAIRTKEGELQRHIQAYAQAESSLTQIWQAENSPGTSAEQWAEAEAAKDVKQLQADSDEVAGLLKTIADLELRKESCEKASGRVDIATAAQVAALNEQKAEEKKVIGENPAVLDLLRRAREYVAGNKTETVCPVCKKPADNDHLAAELDKRIGAMAGLSTATDKTISAKSQFEAAQAQLVSANTHLVESAVKLVAGLTASKLSPVKGTTAPTMEYAQIRDSTLDLGVRMAAVLKVVDFVVTLKSPLDTHRKDADKTITQRTAIATQLQQIRQSRSAQNATDALLKQLKSSLVIVGDIRKAFVKEVLESVSTEIETLYLKLHPKESLGAIKLSLDPDNFGSLFLHGDFHSKKDVPPQSVYSESHLDTLGFCVFLALSKLYKTEDTIIILDDVLTSVDAQHLDRFIDLIHGEEQHFSQIIITTHYRPWCEKYRHHRATGNKVHFIELRGWTLDTGIRVQKMRLSLDELRHALTVPPFDRQVVASKAGVFLESMLDFLARLYECRLPLKANSVYTLGELTACFSSKRLLPALTIERLTRQKDPAGKEEDVWVKIPLAPLIAKIKQWAEIRNLVGCHFNEVGAHCTDADVEELAKATLDLGDALVCSEGGDFPSRSDSGSYHETKSKKVRLHPFVEPN